MAEAMVTFTLNGKPTTVFVDPRELLVDVLRDKLGLTGTKVGCGIGECGACTVIMNGDTVNSCLVLAASVEGAEITTIEGIDGVELDRIQRIFIESGAVQCGFCTPGMILSARVLLQKNPRPSREEIATAISGNLCRCSGYKKIIEAIEKVSRA
ncbi:MAG TPA: (2Fe-2S)-binding protein [Firmicutes bacterium]|nr:(2Fe-2S)-binding protein [Bacillota bacterium]